MVDEIPTGSELEDIIKKYQKLKAKDDRNYDREQKLNDELEELKNEAVETSDLFQNRLDYKHRLEKKKEEIDKFQERSLKNARAYWRIEEDVNRFYRESPIRDDRKRLAEVLFKDFLLDEMRAGRHLSEEELTSIVIRYIWPKSLDAAKKLGWTEEKYWKEAYQKSNYSPARVMAGMELGLDPKEIFYREQRLRRERLKKVLDKTFESELGEKKEMSNFFYEAMNNLDRLRAPDKLYWKEMYENDFRLGERVNAGEKLGYSRLRIWLKERKNGVGFSYVLTGKKDWEKPFIEDTRRLLRR